MAPFPVHNFEKKLELNWMKLSFICIVSEKNSNTVRLFE